jgi:hypothetical protein
VETVVVGVGFGVSPVLGDGVDGVGSVDVPGVGDGVLPQTQ